MDPQLLSTFGFLKRHPAVRARLAAPFDKTVVYSGGMLDPVSNKVHDAWRMLAHEKARDPVRFDYVTLEERLRQFHVVEFGESLFDHANRLAKSLKDRGLADQATIL